MNAIEEIEAAIEKLTELRDSATGGSWWPWHPENGHGNSSVDAATHDPDNPEMVAEGEAGDMELIVALHRTIDAQLGMLRAGRTAFGAAFKETPVPDLPGWAAEARSHSLSFARAINGTTDARSAA